MPDDNSTRGWLEIGGGAVVALLTGWFGLRKQQVATESDVEARKTEAETRKLESEVLEHELDYQDRYRLGTRIARLEAALDAKDVLLDGLRDKMTVLSDNHTRLQIEMGRALAKCAGCSYCNCICDKCKDCTNRKPQGGGSLNDPN